MYLNRFGWILRIVSFFKSSSADVQVFSQVFLCLGQVVKERTLYDPKRFRPSRWSSSGVVQDSLLPCVLYSFGVASFFLSYIYIYILSLKKKTKDRLFLDYKFISIMFCVSGVNQKHEEKI